MKTKINILLFIVLSFSTILAQELKIKERRVDESKLTKTIN